MRRLRDLHAFDLIKSFESAARHLSFTKAAEEHFLTRSAMNRQEKAPYRDEPGASSASTDEWPQAGQREWAWGQFKVRPENAWSLAIADLRSLAIHALAKRRYTAG